jgi:hypothetical protein
VAAPEDHPTVAQAVLFDESLEWFARLGFLEKRQVDGHRAYFVTAEGEAHVEAARRTIERLWSPNKRGGVR